MDKPPAAGSAARLWLRYCVRMGWSCLLEDDAASAKDWFFDAVRAAADDDRSMADAYAGIGECLVQENNYPHALKFFQKALDLRPSDYIARLARRNVKKLSAEKV